MWKIVQSEVTLSKAESSRITWSRIAASRITAKLFEFLP